MLHKFCNLELEGQEEVVKKLPQLKVLFTDNTHTFSYTLSEALDYAEKRKLKIKQITQSHFDDSLFGTTEAYVYDIQNIAQGLLYASFGQEHFNNGYAQNYFAFNAILNNLEEKVRELKNLYSNNYDIIERFERSLKENNSGEQNER